MMKVLILGCGNVGGPVAVQLMERNAQDVELVLGDRNLEAAQALATQIGHNVKAIHIDINDAAGLRAAMKGMNLVFNFVGPFYLSAYPVIEAALEMGVDYMDINDDHDVALKIVSDNSYNERAKAAGTKIIIGCGATPGLTNALARWGANRMDKATAVRMCWVCMFVPDYLSPGVWDHLFHMYTGNVTQYLDGKYQQVPACSGERNVTFLPPFETYPTSFSGHGEAATIPHFIKGLQEASIRSFFFPKAGDDQLRRLVEMGFGSREPLPGLDISPLQFFVKYAASDLGKSCINVEMPEEGFPGSNANQVEVEGMRDGNQVRLTLETHLLKMGGGDPTSVCARVALQTWLRGGLIGDNGVHAVESAIDPEPYIRAVVKDTGMILHEREEIIRKNCFLDAE